MRLSDILKKINNQNPPRPPETKPESTPNTPPSIPVQKEKTPAPAAAPAPVQHETPSQQPPPLFAKKPPVAAEPAKPLSFSVDESYGAAIIEARNIISCIEKGNPYPDAVTSLPALVDIITHAPEEILMLADRATPDIYLHGHCVNVAIFSMFIGRAFDCSRDDLLRLGTCAFLHDTGMAKALGLTLKKEKLSDADLAAVRRHQNNAQEILQTMPKLADDVKTLLREVMPHLHERRNSPQAVTESTHLFARIIAVADVYEALTHPRSYRDRIIPHEALKQMISGAEKDHDPALIKTLVEQLSIYPPGSYVRLNTEEIARVVGINRGLPTRPKVKVMIDSSLQKVPSVKLIDLAATPIIFIKEAIDETKLNLPEKKLSIELKAIRWWVRGL